MAEMQRHDLTRVVLMVLFIGGLIAASFWVLRPFIAPTIWAVMIVVSTWQGMLTVQRFGGGGRAALGRGDDHDVHPVPPADRPLVDRDRNDHLPSRRHHRLDQGPAGFQGAAAAGR